MNSPERKPTAIAAGYIGLLKYLTEAAREQGYALAVHGSMNRDLDLIAVPWVPEAKSADELVKALCKVLGVVKPWFTRGPYLEKPHGRLVWNIHLEHNGYLDLAVMLRWGEAYPEPFALPEVLTVGMRHKVAYQFLNFKECLEVGNDSAALQMVARMDAHNIPWLASQLTDEQRTYLQSPNNREY